LSGRSTLRLVAALTLIWPALLSAQRADSTSWVQRVHGISVVGQDGKEVEAPFLGGLNLPRPQLVDIDGDGDLDLFLQENRNDLKLFERDGDNWVWRSDRWQGVVVGEWFRFADLDDDGDLDLLAEEPIGYIRAYRNDGSASEPRMTAIPDSLRDITGAPIFADPQNILNVVDIDCNGRPDLFLGRVAGYVDRYEQEGVDRNGMPVFRLLEERWQDIEVLGPIPGDTTTFDGRPSRHGANTMSFGDVDSDGDLDLFWGDFFEAGLLLIRNEGSCASPWLRGEHEQFYRAKRVVTTGYNAPATGDVNGDGRLDLVMGVIGGAYQPNYTAVENLHLLLQTGDEEWETVTTRLISMIDVGSESVPALADLDGDGDLDLLVGNKIEPSDDRTGTITLFENTGTPSAPELTDIGPLSIGGTFHLSPAVVDLDGDGLLDIVTGTWQDRVQWWRNAGSVSAPEWEMVDSALVTLTRGSNAVPTLADLDGDGDLDMLVGEASGQLNYYRNDGGPKAPNFTLVSDELGWIDVGRRAVPLLVDLDGDGTVELLIGDQGGAVELWRLIAGDELAFELVTEELVKISDLYAAPAIGDINGDGRIDLLVGGAGGGIRWFQLESQIR
jgi:uncharacterized protein (DUF2141 family)